MRKFYFALLLAGPAFAVGCGSGGSNAPAPANSSGAVIPVDVSEVKYEQLNEAVSERKGNVVLLDFWATWCGPCVARFPHLVEIHKKYTDRGLICMSVSLDQEGPRGSYDKQKVLKFLQEKNATFPNFILLGYQEDAEKVGRRFGLEGGIPFLSLIGKNGNKVWDSETKKLSEEQLNKLIEEQLAK